MRLAFVVQRYGLEVNGCSDVKPGMVVLDLGAGRGGAAKQFTPRGCQAVGSTSR